MHTTRTKATLMSLATSQNNPPPKPRRAVGIALAWLAAYALAVFGLRVLTYRLHLNQMWLVPVLADIVVIKSVWTTSSSSHGVVGRLVGLAVGRALADLLY